MLFEHEHFINLESNSRVWIYQSATVIDENTAKQIQQKIKDFVAKWTAHKLKVNADGMLYRNMFLILAAGEAEVGVSGCSIDSSVRFVKELEKEFGLNFFDRTAIAYTDGDSIKTAHFNDLTDALNNGTINSDILVFNNTITTLQELRDKWIIPVYQSWLAPRLKKQAV